MSVEQRIGHWLEKGLAVKLILVAVGLMGGTWTVSQTVESKLANLREAQAAENIRNLNKENEGLREKLISANSGDAETDTLRTKVQVLETEKRDLAEAFAQSTQNNGDHLRVVKELRERIETAATEHRLALEKQNEALSEREKRLADLVRVNLKLEGDLKKAERAAIPKSELYFNEALVSVGGALTDKLTGATLGITSVSKAFNIVHGIITFPDGTKRDVISEPIGSGWGFVWEKRRFIIGAMSLEKDGRIRLVVKETTER